MSFIAVHHHTHRAAAAGAGPDAEAAAGLAAEVDLLREQTRHTDAKASMLMVAIGVAAAAASSTLPRLSGAALVLGWIALGLAAGAVVPLGAVAWPTTARQPRSAADIAVSARSRAVDTAEAIDAAAAEAAELERIVAADPRRPGLPRRGRHRGNRSCRRRTAGRLTRPGPRRAPSCAGGVDSLWA